MRLFVTHATEDAAVARRVVELVERCISRASGAPGVEVFCSSSSGIAAGTNYIDFIRDQLDDSSVALAIVSPAYSRSAWCQCELGAIWARRGKVIPVLVPPASVPGDLPDILRSTNTAGLDPQGLELLRAGLERCGIRTDERAWAEASGEVLGALERLIPRRMPYDELRTLRDLLKNKVVCERNDSRTDLESLVRKIAPRLGVDPTMEGIMNVIEREIGRHPRSSEAFWWLVVYGFFWFNNIETFNTSESEQYPWRASIGYADLSPRGRALLDVFRVERLDG